MIGKLFLLTLSVNFLLCTGQVHYQVEDTNENRKSMKHSRQPIISEKCVEGEYLYPGDNEKDWVCDCRPGFAYFPATDKCYALYAQGPCKSGELLTLPKQKTVPVCTKNTCGKKVLFNGDCVALDGQKGCPKHLTVQVDHTTLQLKCQKPKIPNRVHDPEEDTPPEETTTPIPVVLPVDTLGAFCIIGGKRSQEGNCINP